MQIKNFAYLLFVIGIFIFDKYWLSMIKGVELKIASEYLI